MDPYALLKPFLFQLPPEAAHKVTLTLLKAGYTSGLSSFFFQSGTPEQGHVTIAGLSFPNRVGLAAGLDKNAEVVDAMLSLGFGFVEIGTVTPRPQQGNPKPRLFRLKQDRALINRMGFNNDGMEVIARRLAKRTKNGIVGGNIGKNKDTPNAQAHQDYRAVFRTLAPYVDYFTVNVSSPNTPDLRELQDKSFLTGIFETLQETKVKMGSKHPIFLKIAPDLNEDQLNDIVALTRQVPVDALIATNTTISRDGLQTGDEQLEAIGAGGLSGAPLTNKANNVLTFLYQHLGTEVPLIASGGVMSGTDALAKQQAGAKLIQVYTGLIYEGPQLVSDILSVTAKEWE